MNVGPGKPIPWESIGEPMFTRLIEALVHAEYPDSVVEVIDGRGGDGGIDILVRHPTHISIFQLKYFPEGFDGRFKDRRKQITRSFERVLSTQGRLGEWVLVYPARPTRAGWTFLKELVAKRPGMKWTTWNRAELDRLCGKHYDVTIAVTRDTDYFRDEVKALNAERAVLSTSADLHQRVQGLGGLAQHLDPDWGVDFQYFDGSSTMLLRAKHDQAHMVSPIAIKSVFEFQPTDEELKKTFTQALGFGAAPVTLPGRIIREFSIDGPRWLSSHGTIPNQIELIPLTSEGTYPELRVTLLSDGVQLGQHMGRVTEVRSGTVGRTLSIAFHHHVDFQLLLPDEVQGATTVEASLGYSLEGASCHDTRLATNLILQLSAASLAEFSMNPQLPLFTVSTSPSGLIDAEWLADLQAMHETAGDLERIEEDCGVSFTFPREMTQFERVNARILALLLKGKCVLQPGAAHLTFTRNSQPLDEQSRPFFAGQPGQIKVEHSPVHWNVLGQDIQIPTVIAWHPNVRVENPDGLSAQPGQDLSVRAVDDTPLRLFLPDRFPPDSPLEPTTPWGLSGISEPKGLRRAQAGQKVTTER